MLERFREKKLAFAKWCLAPASPMPLAVLRVSIAAVLLVQAALLAPDVLDLYGASGLLQRQLRAFLLTPVLPIYVDLFKMATHFGLAPDTLIRVVFLGYVGSLTWLLVGFHSRIACVVAWVATFLLKMNLGYNSSYGVDTFAHIFLFYLMFMPMNRALALDRYLGRVDDDAGEWQRISLYVLRFQLFVVYCSSGIDKGVGPQWWNGEAIWRAHAAAVHGVRHVMARVAPVARQGDDLGNAVHRDRVSAAARFQAHAEGRRARGHLDALRHRGLDETREFALFMIALTGSLFLVPDEEGRRKRNPARARGPDRVD